MLVQRPRHGENVSEQFERFRPRYKHGVRAGCVCGLEEARAAVFRNGLGEARGDKIGSPHVLVPEAVSQVHDVEIGRESLQEVSKVLVEG